MYSQRKLCHATEAAALLLLFPIRAIMSMGCGCAPQVKRLVDMINLNLNALPLFSCVVIWCVRLIDFN